MLDSFTAENSCSITSYRVTSSNSQITQPGCAAPGVSAACQSLTINTLKIGSYNVIFEVTASGGATPVSVTIPLKVDCSPTMKIIVPNPLQPTSQNTTFYANSGDQNYVMNPFSTGVTGCGIESYSFASTSSEMT